MDPWRFFLALHAGRQRVALPRGQWARLVLLSVLNITGWNMFIAYGLMMIASGRAAILAYTMPVMAVPLSMRLLGERLSRAKAVGLVLGMSGLLLLVGESVAAAGEAPLGTVLVLGAAASWALGAVLQKKYPVMLPAGTYTAWIMLLGGLPIFVGALLLEDFSWVADAGAGAFFGTAYNVLVAFAFGHWAWIKLATSLSVTVFSLSMLLIPVVGVFCGMLFLGERPSILEYSALALILASLATVAVPRRGAGV